MIWGYHYFRKHPHRFQMLFFVITIMPLPMAHHHQLPNGKNPPSQGFPCSSTVAKCLEWCNSCKLQKLQMLQLVDLLQSKEPWKNPQPCSNCQRHHRISSNLHSRRFFESLGQQIYAARSNNNHRLVVIFWMLQKWVLYGSHFAPPHLEGPGQGGVMVLGVFQWKMHHDAWGRTATSLFAIAVNISFPQNRLHDDVIRALNGMSSKCCDQMGFHK